ncbi:MAG: Ig-like domain-containing protein [Halobacteriota archaeon]
MKRNRIEEESGKDSKEARKGKKSSKKLVTVMMVAMIVMAAMTAFIASAAADEVTNFEISPNTGITNAEVSYSATINTTGFTTLNITIPAGFIAVAPTSGGVIAEIDVYNATGTHGKIIIEANATDPGNKIDVTATATDAGDTISASATGIEVYYAPGATTSISRTATYNGKDYTAGVTLKLPTDSTSGSLNISVPAELNIRNGSIAIGNFVRNPAVGGDYAFVADGVQAVVRIDDGEGPTITILAPDNDTEVTVNYVNVTAEITDPNGVDNVSVVLNWSGAENSMTVYAYAYTVGEYFCNMTGLANGTYEYYVRANDTFNNTNQSETRFVTVNVSEGAVTATIPLQAGWNMVSLPIDPTDSSVSSVFADVEMYGASVYEYTAAGYNPVTTVQPKEGYWVYSADSTTIDVTGSSITNTIDLQAGWNMVGLPVTPTDSSVSSVFADVEMYGASVYEYTAAGYNPVTTVQPKEGYWVYSADSITITVPGTPVTE